MSRRIAYRILAAAAGALALLLTAPGVASAHPLGNFTVNRYTGVVVSADAVTLDHVLDLAEIPTAQRSPAIDRDHNGTLAPAELSRWSSRQCQAAAHQLRASVDGRPLAFHVAGALARSVTGQAGLPVLRLECRLRAPASVTGNASLDVTDTAAADQVGWREVTARGDGVRLTGSDVPRRSTSARLTSYPSDLLRSPLDVRGAHLALRPGGRHLPGADAVPGVPVVASGVTGTFQDLATRYDGSPLVAVTALLVALALGAGHAAAPGHGKTIMALYLSGRREGAWRAAGTVGATVTVTHTAGVVALGLLVSTGTAFVPARVYPWLSVASGVLVVAVGLSLLRGARAGHTHGPGGHSHGPDGHSHGPRGHSHGPGGHHHDDHASPVRAAAQPAAGAVAVLVADDPHPHDHPHPHEHPHHGHAHHGHAHHDGPQPASGPTSRRGLVAMGLAGGLLPSPSAVLVFLGATAVGHPWFGLLLVLAFGLGMATTLAVVGVLVLRLRDQVGRRLQARSGSRLAPVLRVLPVLTALTVVTLGAVVAARGLGAVGG